MNSIILSLKVGVWTFILSAGMAYADRQAIVGTITSSGFVQGTPADAADGLIKETELRLSPNLPTEGSMDNQTVHLKTQSTQDLMIPLGGFFPATWTLRYTVWGNNQANTGTMEVVHWYTTSTTFETGGPWITSREGFGKVKLLAKRQVYNGGWGVLYYLQIDRIEGGTQPIQVSVTLETNNQLDEVYGTNESALTSLEVPEVFSIDQYTKKVAFNSTVEVTGSMSLNGSSVLTQSSALSGGFVQSSGTGSINLIGTTPGINANGASIFSLGADGKVTYATNRPLSVTSTSQSISSTTGALTIAGGLGVATDSYINGVRIGRGGGNVVTNTILGASSMYNNTTGFSNTSMGSSSMLSNITGYQNTAFGYDSMRINSSGNINTAVGSYSLRSNTSGNANTAVGQTSLMDNTTGGGNTAAGVDSLRANTTGSSNAAYGYGSLRYNTVGFLNSAIGNWTLSENTTGSKNTAIGNSALGANTTGQENVALGSEAGRYQSDGTPLVSSHESIYIGSYSKGNSNSDSNSIVIGSWAVGEGSNTTVIGNSDTLKTHLHGETHSDSLRVTGDTVLEGQVIISVPQGDISMGIYE